jgi:hypothetical protein
MHLQEESPHPSPKENAGPESDTFQSTVRTSKGQAGNEHVDAAEQLKQFANCLYAPDDWVEIRRLPSGKSTWHSASELSSVADSLKRENNEGQGLFVSANPRTARGGTKAEDVSKARCVFADFDNIAIDDVLSRIETAGLPSPTCVTWSGHGVHTYWKLKEHLTDLEGWKLLQRRLAATLSSDSSVNDAPRVMRLPGFVNHKAPACRSFIVSCNPGSTYELGILECSLEAIEDAPATFAPVEPRFDSSASGLERALSIAASWPPASDGERNTHAYRYAARLVRDLGLDPILAGDITQSCGFER